jgi:hypothetical protein
VARIRAILTLRRGPQTACREQVGHVTLPR